MNNKTQEAIVIDFINGKTEDRCRELGNLYIDGDKLIHFSLLLHSELKMGLF